MAWGLPPALPPFADEEGVMGGVILGELGNERGCCWWAAVGVIPLAAAAAACMAARWPWW